MSNYSLQALLPLHLQTELSLVKSRAVALWKTPQHRTFTDHQPEGHSERVIAKLNALTAQLANSDEQLSSAEAFVVLAAAYLHDIRMQAEGPQYGSLDEIRDRHHLISQEMILGSVSDPSKFPHLGLSAEFAEEVALVAAAHRKLDLREDRFERIDKGAGTLRLRLLSALLRFADSLDMDYQRVNMEILKVMEVPQEGRLHWWRCHYIAAVSAHNGVITATCEVPDEDYGFLLTTSVEHELLEELAKVQEFLWPPIRLRVGPVKTRVSGIKQRMNEGDFALLRGQTEQLLARSPHEAMVKIAEMREREERHAQTTSQEARRVSDADPPDLPRAVEFHQQAAKAFLGLGLLQSVADELEYLAQVHLKRSDKAAAAHIYEQIGQLHLGRDEPFMARVKFNRAAELTPRSPASAPADAPRTDGDSQGQPNVDEGDLAGSQAELNLLRRNLLTVIPGALLGEFNPLVNLLDNAEQRLAAKPAPVELAQLFLNSQILFWSLQNDWQRGLHWARQWTDFEERVWQGSPPETRESMADPRAYYEGSLCASLAGDHELALTWIERVFAFHATEITADAGLQFSLHGRRAYLRARSDEWSGAVDDFVAALEGAEAMGSEERALACLENAITAAERAGIHLESLPNMARRQARLREMRGEAWRIQDALKPTLLLDTQQLYDAHSNHLITFHRALSENDWRGVRVVQRSLATLYRQANRWPQALGALAKAGMHDEAVAWAGEFARRDIEGARQVGGVAATLVLHHGASTPERYTVTRIAAATVDLIPDEHIEPVAAQLLLWCEAEREKSARSFLPGVVLPFMKDSSERLVPSTLAGAVALAQRVLDPASPSAYGSECRKAALSFLAGAIEELPPTEHDAIVTLAIDFATGDDAPKALQLLARSATGLSEAPRERARAFLFDLATVAASENEGEKDSATADDAADEVEENPRSGLPTPRHRPWATRIYLGTNLGALPLEVVSNLADFYVELVTGDAQIARGVMLPDGRIRRQFRLHDDGPLSSFDCLVDVFSPQQVAEMGQDLLFLSDLSDTPFPMRQDALAALTLLVPRLPASLRSEVARVARECALSLSTGVMHDMMHHSASDPFNRFKSSIGTPEAVRTWALDLVATCCCEFDEGTRREGIACLLQATSDAQVEVRAAAVCNLGLTYEVTTEEERTDAGIQVLLGLQDGEEQLVQQANFAASHMTPSVPVGQTNLFLRRWNALAREGSPCAQISTARALQRVLEATRKGETHFGEDDLNACLQSLQDSPSHRARRVALDPSND